MKLYVGTDPTSDETQFTRTAATVQDGTVSITRKIFFQAESDSEDSTDILALDYFPVKRSVHPRDPRFKYYGNATIQPLSESSRIWVAELEYSTKNTNNTDSDGAAITKDTKPWKLLPDDISITFPEENVPFTCGYNNKGKKYDNNGNAYYPVVNAVGDKILAETVQRKTRISFTYAVKKFDIKDLWTYGNTTNSKTIKVCGITIPQYTGLLLPPEADFITVYKENSSHKDYDYWSIHVTLMLDTNKFARTFLNVGNRAFEDTVTISGDALMTAAGMPTFQLYARTGKSQICCFRKTVALGGTYVQLGDLVFCGWDQYIGARTAYYDASVYLCKQNKISAPVELQCEQLEDIPLDQYGKIYGRAIPGHSAYVADTPYPTKTFMEYPPVDWSALDLPEKGIGH